jgi:hypothetical protein
VAQAAELLLCKCEALNSNPSPTKNKNTNKQKKRYNALNIFFLEICLKSQTLLNDND